MRRAIELAQEGMRCGDGGPFGALVAQGDAVVAEGWNMVIGTNDPTAHAEVTAIRRACQVLGSFQLAGCDLYTSCEPCPMCLGAIYWARLRAVYYANTQADAAAIGFDDAFIYHELAQPYSKRQIPFVHLPLPAALDPFTAWRDKVDKIAY